MEIEESSAAAGKFAGTVKVGRRAGSSSPRARAELFGIKPGDTLLLLADIDQGIAIVRQDLFDRFIAQAMPAAPGAPTPARQGSAQEDEPRP